MDEIIRVWDMLWDIYSKAEGTPWENTIPIIVVGAVLFLLVKWIIIPLGKVYINYMVTFQTSGLSKSKFMRN